MKLSFVDSGQLPDFKAIDKENKSVVRHFRATENRKNSRRLLYNAINWFFSRKYKIMARNTSILIGEYYENFINGQIATGKYNSVSEVGRTALRHLNRKKFKRNL